MTRQEALAIYRKHGLLLAQFGVREDVAAKLFELENQIADAKRQGDSDYAKIMQERNALRSIVSRRDMCSGCEDDCSRCPANQRLWR